MIVDFSLSREKLKHELRAMEYCSQLKAQRSSVNTRARLDSLTKLIIFHFDSLYKLLPFYYHRPVDCCFYPLPHQGHTAACTFFTSGRIPVRVTQYPRYSHSCLPKNDLSALTLRPASARFCGTCSN